MREFKRYSNRRLYDAETSTTVTLEDVAEVIQAGEEVRIIDNATGEDITPKVLGQTFIKLSVDQQSHEFSAFLLTALIRELGNNLTGFFSRLVQGGIGGSALTEERLQRIVRDLVNKGYLSDTDEVDFSGEIRKQIEARVDQIAMKAAVGKGVIQRTGGNVDEKKIEELSSKLGELEKIVRDMKS